jgi:hypothetical protein
MSVPPVSPRTQPPLTPTQPLLLPPCLPLHHTPACWAFTLLSLQCCSSQALGLGPLQEGDPSRQLSRAATSSVPPSTGSTNSYRLRDRRHNTATQKPGSENRHSHALGSRLVSAVMPGIEGLWVAVGKTAAASHFHK